MSARIRPLLAFACLFVSHTNLHSQASSGPRNATMFSNDNVIGVYSIGVPANAAASDNNYASASAILSLLSGNTNYLKATGFGFSIPAGTIIRGIIVQAEKSATGINIFTDVTDNSVRLVKGGVITGSNRASGASWSSSDSYSSYGSSSDLWGTTWTPADINAADFGVVFSASISGIAALLPSARIDHIRVTVHYDFIVVPLQITGFSGTALNDHSAKLEWSVAHADEEAVLSIQRSDNGLEWTTIHQQPVEINQPAKNGHYTDPRCSTHTAFYRLRVQHSSGQLSYSQTIKLEWKQASLTLYPNPAGDYLLITQKEPLSFMLCKSMDGRTWPLPYSAKGAGAYQVTISHLLPGTYMLFSGKKSSLFIKL